MRANKRKVEHCAIGKKGERNTIDHEEREQKRGKITERKGRGGKGEDGRGGEREKERASRRIDRSDLSASRQSGGDVCPCVATLRPADT